MSQAAQAEVQSVGHPQFDRIIRESQAWLAERGRTIVGSGTLESGPLAVALHTDFGPADQDKTTNQDYALAWCPREAGDRKSLRLVLAMADGLTASFRSECGSALACWTALRALAGASRSTEPLDLARLAFAEAGLTIGQLADELVRDPEASCPEGQFLSTWKYILKKGGLFQTTLTLLWLDRDSLYLAMLGDGGAVWRGPPGSNGEHQAADQVLAQCDLTTQSVRALGPADRSVREFDCWREERLNGPFFCALHSDGIGRGLGDHPLALLDALETLQAAGTPNPSQSFIERAIAQSPAEYADNLTLAMIRTM